MLRTGPPQLATGGDDYTAKDQSLCDYQGDEFLSSEAAFDFAEATAQALKSSLNDDWKGWSVEVRDAAGTIYFSVPVMSVRAATTPAIAKADASANNPRSLLVIEDEPIHSTLISRIAGRLGFTTTAAHSYEDACNVLAAAQFDCITLDLGLGEHIGVDVLRYLSTIQCRAQIIVISHAGKDVCDDVVELGKTLDLNIYDALLKPIDLEVLRDTLQHIKVQSPARNSSPA
jgi:two-component system, chemotaxis family, chemotaxis protein CheY